MDEQYQNLTKRERRSLRREEKQRKQLQKTQKQFISKIFLWLLIALCFIGLILIVFKASSSQKQPGLSLDSASASDWVKGDKDAKVVLVEYSDFQCPACARLYLLVKQLEKEFGAKAFFVYRHFPLKNLHQNAEPAAFASEAAGRQNKFWAMHDLLFDKQTEWSDKDDAKEVFFQYAQELGLDVEKFKSDLDSQEVKEKVANDILSGQRGGVRGTPAFFINGKIVQKNPIDYDQFKQLLQQAIDAYKTQ